jgi:hypothetical protein
MVERRNTYLEAQGRRSATKLPTSLIFFDHGLFLQVQRPGS